MKRTAALLLILSVAACEKDAPTTSPDDAAGTVPEGAGSGGPAESVLESEPEPAEPSEEAEPAADGEEASDEEPMDEETEEEEE